jgi:restriction system protein
MAIPDYQSLMSPVLSLMADNKTRSVKEVIEALAVLFNWTAEDLEELFPSGSQPVAHSRINWAITYLKKSWITRKPTQISSMHNRRRISCCSSSGCKSR